MITTLIGISIIIAKMFALWVGARAWKSFKYGWKHSDSEAYLECMICIILFVGIGYTLTTCD